MSHNDAEYDDNIMLSESLESIASQAMELKKKIEAGLQLPSWAEYKVYQAYDGINKAFGTAYPGRYEKRASVFDDLRRSDMASKLRTHLGSMPTIDWDEAPTKYGPTIAAMTVGGLLARKKAREARKLDNMIKENIDYGSHSLGRLSDKQLKERERARKRKLNWAGRRAAMAGALATGAALYGTQHHVLPHAGRAFQTVVDEAVRKAQSAAQGVTEGAKEHATEAVRGVGKAVGEGVRSAFGGGAGSASKTTSSGSKEPDLGDYIKWR